MMDKVYNPFTGTFDEIEQGLIIDTSKFLNLHIPNQKDRFVSHCLKMKALRNSNYSQFKKNVCKLQCIMTLAEAKEFFKAFYSDKAFESGDFLFFESPEEFSCFKSAMDKFSAAFIA